MQVLRLVLAEEWRGRSGSGIAQSCIALEAKLSLPWGFCVLWEAVLFQRETPRAVGASAWTQSVGCTSSLVGKRVVSISAMVHWGVHPSVVCLIWKYGKDPETQRCQCEFCHLCNIEHLHQVQALSAKLRFARFGSNSRLQSLKSIEEDKTKYTCNVKYRGYQNMIF